MWICTGESNKKCQKSARDGLTLPTRDQGKLSCRKQTEKSDRQQTLLMLPSVTMQRYIFVQTFVQSSIPLPAFCPPPLFRVVKSDWFFSHLNVVLQLNIANLVPQVTSQESEKALLDSWCVQFFLGFFCQIQRMCLSCLWELRDQWHGRLNLSLSPWYTSHFAINTDGRSIPWASSAAVWSRRDLTRPSTVSELRSTLGGKCFLQFPSEVRHGVNICSLFPWLCSRKETYYWKTEGIWGINTNKRNKQTEGKGQGTHLNLCIDARFAGRRKWMKSKMSLGIFDWWVWHLRTLNDF